MKIKKIANENKKIQDGLSIGKNFWTLSKSSRGVLVSSKLEGGLSLNLLKIKK